MGEPFVTNILSNKYDTALDYHVTMYDKLPYERDSDYCNVEKVALNSGKVLKFFLCMYQPESILIDNKDKEIEQYLLELKMRQQKQKELKKSASRAELPSDEVTDEQIQTLLDDKGEGLPEMPEDTFNEEEDEVLGDTTNPFADVEDW